MSSTTDSFSTSMQSQATYRVPGSDAVASKPANLIYTGHVAASDGTPIGSTHKYEGQPIEVLVSGWPGKPLHERPKPYV